MPKLVLKNIYKRYDDFLAVDNFNLEIEEKEFIVLVGPSGCGKSTTLRMIAGLEEISDGELIINGKLMNKVEPKNRDIAMVFQNYALYPHMTVGENIGYGLKVRKTPKAVMEQKINEAADILGLNGLLDRKPGELSGGQRQRVALGRAVVRDVDIFLMDEPLSNLDAKLRVVMRSEIATLHKKMGSTTIYVTHDQVEAMTMASRIVIMNHGVIQQVGSPKEVYNRPKNTFVASFIGSPPMNLFDGQFDGENLIVKDAKESDVIELDDFQRRRLSDLNIKNLIVGVRPEHLTALLPNEQDAKNTLSMSVKISELYGSEQILHTESGDLQLVSKIPPDNEFSFGDKVSIRFDINQLHYFDAETKERLDLV